MVTKQIGKRKQASDAKHHHDQHVHPLRILVQAYRRAKAHKDLMVPLGMSD